MRTQLGIYLTQKKYVTDLLQETGIIHAKAVESPLESGLKFMPDEGEMFEDASRYRRLVGKLMQSVLMSHCLCLQIIEMKIFSLIMIILNLIVGGRRRTRVKGRRRSNLCGTFGAGILYLEPLFY